MRIIKTIASALIVGLAFINWLPIEEVAKVTRLLPDNFFSDRAEIQFIDQEIRGIVRRYARSEERNNKQTQDFEDKTKALILDKSFTVTSFDDDDAHVRIQSYLSKTSHVR